MKVRLGMYKDELDYESYRTKTMLEYSKFGKHHKIKTSFFKRLKLRYKLLKLKIIRKRNPDILYMDL